MISIINLFNKSQQFKALQNSLNEKTQHWEQAVNRCKEVEADLLRHQQALNERTKHWEEAVSRNKELEAELTWLHKGNRGLMEELQFLKTCNKELSDLHDNIVLDKWKNNHMKKNITCKFPFTRIEVLTNGDVYTCCSAYLKRGFSIGNIYKSNSFDEIWNSDNAKKLRYSVAMGDFEYCTKNCPWLHSGNDLMGGGGNPLIDRDINKYNFVNYADCYMKNLPEDIALSCDDTCNLSCQSCRTHKKINSKDENDKLSNLLEKIIRPALKNCKTLTALGSGEFFLSKPIGEFCKTLSKREFPDLKINIGTNAQLVFAETIAEFNNLKGMLGTIKVSVDAVEKDTYELLRMGGKWDRLQDALLLISDMRQNNEIECFELRFVVQKSNFKQIIPFIAFAKRIKVDTVVFQRIINWGTFSRSDFLDMDVLNPLNENYNETRTYIEQAIKDRDLIVIQNCL